MGGRVMEETRVLKAEKSRIGNFLQLDALVLIFGIGAFIPSFQTDSWWHWPGMIFGVLVFLRGIFQVVRTFFVFRTEMTISAETISVKLGNYRIEWSDLYVVVIRERQKGVESGRPDRLVILIAKPDLSITINSNVFSTEDESFLLRLIREKSRKHGFEVKMVEDL